MILLILFGVLPLGDLESDNYRTRQAARRAIVSTGTEAEILEALKGDISVEARMSLASCLELVIKREDEQERQLLVRTGETRLPGWKEYRRFVGDTTDSRNSYALMWRKHRDELRSFFALPAGADRSRYLQTLRAEFDSSWDIPTGLFAFMVLIEPVPSIRDELIRFSQWRYCECMSCQEKYEPYSRLVCELLKKLKEKTSA